MGASLPDSMTCIEIKAPGGPEQLVPVRRPVPQPSTGQVLIRVEAAGVNRPDVLQRMGRYPAPPGASDIPGLEVAGTVVAQGEATPTPKIGTKVCALISGGGYAEFAVAPSGSCLPYPRDFESVHAAALPETFFTVWHNVFERGALKSGEIFLVHGGTSGIGTTAIQLAKAFGAFVVATAGSDEKCAACRDLGADLAINYRTEDFVEAVKAGTPQGGADLVLDMVGGSYTQRNIRCLRPDGSLVNIAFLEGSKMELDLMPVMLKRLTLTGSTLRARDDRFKSGLAKTLRERVWPLLNSGQLGPVIHQTFPLKEAALAHRCMETGAHIGKLVLIPEIEN